MHTLIVVILKLIFKLRGSRGLVIYGLVHCISLRKLRLRLFNLWHLQFLIANCRDDGFTLRMLQWTFVNIIVKISFFQTSIWEAHSPNTMLNSFLPRSNVFTSVRPPHFSLPFSFIVHILPSINIS